VAFLRTAASVEESKGSIVTPAYAEKRPSGKAMSQALDEAFKSYDAERAEN
jgi:hypothetical protein